MKIAVVIPALDEADQIAGAIRSARGFDRDPSDGPSEGPVEHRKAAPESAPEPCPDEASAFAVHAREPDDGRTRSAGAAALEILVVDGGSRDGTPMRARRAGARVIDCEPGRARQLEVGWRASAAEAIVFLHADTRLESGWERAVLEALRDPGVAGGAFRLRFDGRGPLLRVLELGVRLRVKLLGLPYGDQAIFARRSALEAMGGIPTVEVMEDLDLVAAIKSQGDLIELSLHATTSPRRYLEQGALRTIGRHLLALAAWRLGLDRRRVASWVHR